MKWGLDNETVARQCEEHQTKYHQQFSVQHSGLVLNQDYPVKAASPDGISSCTCCGLVCIEIKCPYSLRDKYVDEAV